MNEGYNLIKSVVNGFGAALGFVIVLFAGLEKN